MQTGQPGIKAYTYSCPNIKKENLKIAGIIHLDFRTFTLPHAFHNVIRDNIKQTNRQNA